MNIDAVSSNARSAALAVVSWAAGRYHLDPSQVGAMTSDISYVGAVALFGYNTFAHWGMKKVPVAAIAVGLLAGSIVVGATHVRAADMPVKAPPAPVAAFPYSTAGAYWGVTAFASQTAVNVNAPGATAGQATIDGGSIGVVGGYSMPINKGANFLAFEGSASAQNINGSAQQAGGVLSVKGPWRLEGIVKLGMPCANIAAYLPNLGSLLPTFPALPAGAIASNCHAYVGGGAAAEDISATLNVNGGGQASSGSEWSGAGVAKLGQIWQLSNGFAADTWIEYETNGRSFSVSGPPKATPSIQGQAHRVLAGINFDF